MDLEDYRKEIDRVNHEIVDDVSRRMTVVNEIAALKQEKDMDIVDESREEEVKQQFEKLFRKEELPEKKGRELAELLIEIATEKQRQGR